MPAGRYGLPDQRRYSRNLQQGAVGIVHELIGVDDVTALAEVYGNIQTAVLTRLGTGDVSTANALLITHQGQLAEALQGCDDTAVIARRLT